MTQSETSVVAKRKDDWQKVEPHSCDARMNVCTLLKDEHLEEVKGLQYLLQHAVRPQFTVAAYY